MLMRGQSTDWTVGDDPGDEIVNDLINIYDAEEPTLLSAGS